METYYTAKVKGKNELIILFKKEGYFTEEGTYTKRNVDDVFFDIEMFRFCGKEIELIEDNKTDFDFFDATNSWGWCKEWLVEDTIKIV